MKKMWYEWKNIPSPANPQLFPAAPALPACPDAFSGADPFHPA